MDPAAGFLVNLAHKSSIGMDELSYKCGRSSQINKYR